jgi:hypothetical protein
MEFKYAHLADYAGDGGRGKVTVVGIFDTLFVTPERPIKTPPMGLVATFEAHVTEGTNHELELRFCDEDGGDIFPRAKIPLRFASGGPGRPLRANAFVQLGPLELPDLGEYAFHIFVNGREMTGIPLHVVAMPGPVGAA